MKVTAEKIPESKVLLRIEIPPEQVQQAIDKTYRDLSRQVRIPGFRPGKAPRPLVERYLGGPDSIQHEGIDRLVDDAYRKALQETDTHPITDPDLAEHPEFHPGEPLVIEATVSVAPTVELGDYQKLRAQPLAVEATNEQVEEFLNELLEGNAEWIDVERPIQDHDQATIDVVGVAGTVPTLYGAGGETLLQTEGGKEVFNVKDHEHSIDVQGPIEFAPGFDEELVGKTPGEYRFGLTLPADFRDPELANQSIVFNVTIKAVKEKHRPELDDAFAQKVGGGDTVDALRTAVRDRLQDRLERDARTLYEDSLVEALLGQTTIEIPEVLVERQIDAQLEDIQTELNRQQIPYQMYLDQQSKTEEQLRADMRESAQKTLMRYLLLREIAQREGLQVSPTEINDEIDTIASQFGRAQAMVRERMNSREQRDSIESRLLRRKTLDRLVEVAGQAPIAETSDDAPVASAPVESTSLTDEGASNPPDAITSSGEPTSPVEGGTNEEKDQNG